MDQDRLAEYFGCSVRLLPHLEELLVDFWELGSEPERVARWLAQRGLDERARVLDLGCGKGAVSITVAATIGARVSGVDAYPPFIAAAWREAQARGVGGRCHFEVADIRDAVAAASGHDAVLYISVGGVFGSHAQDVAALRSCVRPGGLMILDDAYRLGPAIDFPGYQHVLDRQQTLAQLTAHGDHVLAEREIPLAEVQQQNRLYQGRIERRGHALAERAPELAEDIEAYIEKERAECAIIEKDIQSAMWLLERVDVSRG